MLAEQPIPHSPPSQGHKAQGAVGRPLPSLVPRSVLFRNKGSITSLIKGRLQAPGTLDNKSQNLNHGQDTRANRTDRDPHETATRTSQTNLKTNRPINRRLPHRHTRQTTPKPRDARATTHRTTHPIKRGGGDGDGDGARTWEQRGRDPDGIGDGTPPRAGRRGGKRLRHPREADRAHGSCPAARTGHEYARCGARSRRQKASWQ